MKKTVLIILLVVAICIGAFAIVKAKSANKSANNGISKEQMEKLDYYISKNPPIAGPYFSRGMARLQSNDFQGAIEDFDNAIKIENNNAKYYRYRGMAKLRADDTDGAYKDFEQALLIDPNDKMALSQKNRLNSIKK